MRRYTEGEVLNTLRMRFQPKTGQTQTQTAAKIGFSVAYIYALLNGDKPVTKEVAEALGFRKVVEFVKKAA